MSRTAIIPARTSWKFLRQAEASIFDKTSKNFHLKCSHLPYTNTCSAEHQLLKTHNPSSIKRTAAPIFLLLLSLVPTPLDARETKMAEKSEVEKNQENGAGAGNPIVEVNPEPQKGLTSKLLDYLEKLIVNLMHDTSQSHHYLSGNFAPVLDETAPVKDLPVKGHLPVSTVYIVSFDKIIVIISEMINNWFIYSLVNNLSPLCPCVKFIKPFITCSSKFRDHCSWLVSKF